MRVPIDDYAFLDLDAPTVGVDEVLVDGATRWRFWCPHCLTHHTHGPAEGHREAHCCDGDSPYRRTGYNLALKDDA